GEDRTRNIADVETDWIDRRRSRAEEAKPGCDRVAERVASRGVDVGERRAAGYQCDRGEREQPDLGSNRGCVAGADELERYREHGDLSRDNRAGASADQCYAENGCDQRACAWMRKFMAPQPPGDQQSDGAHSGCDAEHLRRRELEDDQSRHDGGQQSDPRDQVIGEGGGFEGSPVEPGPGARQHARIVGKEPLTKLTRVLPSPPSVAMAAGFTPAATMPARLPSVASSGNYKKTQSIYRNGSRPVAQRPADEGKPSGTSLILSGLWRFRAIVLQRPPWCSVRS